MIKKNKQLNLIVLLLVLCFAISGLGATNAHAASTRKKAFNAYKKMLSKSKLRPKTGYSPYKVKTKKLEFAVAYIDNNNVPELVVRRRDRAGFGMAIDDLVYTYYKGKIRQLYDSDGSMGIIDVENGHDCLYCRPKYYKKTGVLFSVMQYGESVYWILSKGKLHRKTIWYHPKEWTESGETEYYDEDNNRISKEEFDSLKKELTKGKKSRHFKFHKNTKKNRKKYLK